MQAILISDQGLMSTNGTSAGTTILKAAQIEPERFRPVGMTAVLGGRVVFVGQDQGYNQLWITDGTSAGTGLIATLPASAFEDGIHAAIRSPTSVGSHVLFAYSDGSIPSSPGGLWTTDGTQAGTQLITLETTLFGGASAFLGDGRLVLAGNGLWVSDGTAAGTMQVSEASNDFRLNLNGSMAGLGTQVVFPVVSGGGGSFQGGVNQLWVTDGTADGTRLVMSLAGDAGDISPQQFVALGGRVLFDHDGAWASDGTADGTIALPETGRTALSGGAVLGDRLVFLATHGVWATDGTAGGTVLLRARDDDAGFQPRSDVTMVTVGNVTVFAVSRDFGAAKEIWRTDGTVGGTELVFALPYSAHVAGVYQMAGIGDRALIAVSDGAGGTEFWSTDGTAPGTVKVLDGFVPYLGSLELIPCFVRGTRIRTMRGDVAVEALAVGDMVPGARSGRVQAMVWIGYRRVEAARHPRPADVWPVCIRAQAIGPGVPGRDVWLSPEHGVFVHGVLVPARLLVNGISIVQMPCATVEYYHVELVEHDLVLTEGMLSESYLDTGNRGDFQNATVVNAHPSFGADHASRVWGDRACAPQVRVGAALAAIQATLARRAHGMMAEGVALRSPTGAVACHALA